MLARLFSILATAYAAVTTFDVASCGDASDIMTNVEVFVDPVLPQTDYTLFVSGDMSTVVTSGTSVYDITLNGLPLSPTTNDLCTELASSNTSCPIAAEHFAAQSKGTVPAVSGKTVIQNQWFDSDTGTRILCMEFLVRQS